MDAAGAQPLPGTEDAEFPFWSPDSKWVGFGQEAKLKKIDIGGGPPVPIADLASRFFGGSWSSDGIIIFGVQGNYMPLWRVAATGGTPAPLIPLEKGRESRSYRHPWFLPDGRHFLYTNSQSGQLSVRAGSLDEPNTQGKVVAQGDSNAAFAQGYLLYLRENTLLAQPFDSKRLETTGEAIPVAEGVPTFMQPSRPAGFTVSASGLLVYQSGAASSQSSLIWKDRQGQVLGNLGEPTNEITYVSLSPDGKNSAAVIMDRSGNLDIWVYDTARSISTRFTFDPAADTAPVWSPDGKNIYFGSTRKGQYNIYRKASDGSGEEELLLADPTSKVPSSISPDGKLLLYTKTPPNKPSDIWLLPLSPVPASGKPEPRPFLETPFVEANAQFSPDGRWVAYDSNESGRYQIYVVEFPGRGGKRQISNTQSRFPRWRRDGKELFYRTAEGQVMATELSAHNGTVDVGRTQRLFEGLSIQYAPVYDVSDNGQKFLVVDQGVVPTRSLNILENWKAALRR